MMRLSVTVYGTPMAYVRQTQRDRWARRPAVLRYRAWCHLVRTVAGIPEPQRATGPLRLTVCCYLPRPTSWSQKMRDARAGTWHAVTPDADNLLKAIADALVVNDQMIVEARVCKRWDDGVGPRVEVSIEHAREEDTAPTR